MKKELIEVFQSLSKTFSHSGAIKGILSAGIVVGINQLVEFAAFECPCKMEETPNMTNRLTQARDYSLQHLKRVYSSGLLFILAPAAILFSFGFVVNETFCRNVTGCCKSETSGVQYKTKDFIKAFCGPIVLSVTWIALSLIDGDYLACSLTRFPYEFSKGQTCKTPTVRLFAISHF